MSIELSNYYGVTIPSIEAIPEDWSLGHALDLLKSALDGPNETQREIVIHGVTLTALLLIKNTNYGNSALQPVRVFSRNTSREERMGVRMDDKLSRIVYGTGADAGDGEDPYWDLAGYLLLLLVGRRILQETER